MASRRLAQDSPLWITWLRESSLKFDPTFQAAKKKTAQQRKQAARETFGGRLYGSRTARKISAILAASCLTENSEAFDPNFTESALRDLSALLGP